VAAQGELHAAHLEGPSANTAVDPRTLTVAFNEQINQCNLDGLANLMSDDHTFIDTAGHAIRGKFACLDAWRGFFKAYPDYRNIFDWVVVQNTTVVVVGRSICSDLRLDGPALWVAKVGDDKLDEWRVYEDTPANRRLLDIASGSTRGTV
jgi:ketosteroid isomerase-like protein